MNKLPTLPQGEIDTMVDTVTCWVDRVAAALTSEFGHRLLRNDIRGRLQAGTIETLKLIAAAEQGHQDADLALREFGAEMLDRGEMPDATLRAYLVKALVAAPVTYPPGRNIADTWIRDIAISVLVALAMMHWPHLKATRNRASKRFSISTIAALALTKRGHPLSEWQVGRIHGEHNKLAGRLSASIALD
jgi:hypothetical protein